MPLTHPYDALAVHPFDTLALGDDQGSILFTPCPGTKDVDLATSLDQLKQAGAVAIVTLMQGEEMERHGVQALPELCQQKDLLWFHFPVADDSAPADAFAHAWQRDKQQVHALLDQGKTIALHCKGGSGRTGLVAAQILYERGVEQGQVFERVQALRPQALRHAVQADYIQRLFSSAAI